MAHRFESRLARVCAVLTALVCSSAAATPQRIVSLNACADPYLIVLADRSQIAALTQFARNPQISVYSEKAKQYPTTGGQTEAVLALKPDLVIVSPFQRSDALTQLNGRMSILRLASANSFDDVVSQTRAIAQAIGHPARGEALIRNMTARVAAAGRRPMKGVAAHYQRGGYIDGKDTLMDDLMSRAGLINLARRSAGALGRLSLEQILVARPDFLVLSTGVPTGEDEGALLFDHPALAAAVPPSHRIYIPEAMTVCGGPFYPDALERMQSEAARAGR